MKKLAVLILSTLTLTVVVLGVFFVLSRPPASPPHRTTAEYPLQPDSPPTSLTIPATILPQFTFDLSEHKFDSVISATRQLSDFITASLVHSVSAQTLDTQLEVDRNQRKLLVHPKDIPRFKPGLYKLSLTLRTPEGFVNIDQDFTWGVIAVNTHKSIYKPGETVKIGLAVLNDAGETQCADSLLDWVDSLKLTITDPRGIPQTFSLSDGTITDSGECASTSVTNMADFQAVYTTTTPGIYQMHVTAATARGQTRTLDDYFKVESDIPFDIERTSFPTRIYPPSPYPVTFTITSQKDYSGPIEDVVPAFFTIDHISDNGKITPAGDFTKIIWDAHLTASQSQTFTYFIKFPMVSPEFYLLGPISVGSFQEARQWQIASDVIASTTGVVSYEDNAASATWSRVWDGSAFGSQGNMDTDPDDSRWFREVSSPKTGEKLVALIDNSTSPAIDTYYVFRWNGSSWTEDLAINWTACTTLESTRNFDIAYEEISGDALFVFGNCADNQLYYRARVGGTWDSSDQNAGTALDSRKWWVQARAQFGSDSILVGYVNNSARIGALIWDGSSNTFTNQFEDDDSPAQTEVDTTADEAFGVAWETASGTPMIFWGSAGNDVLYREFTGGSWSGESTAHSGFTNDVEWLTIAADPVATSNNIALAIQEEFDSDLTDEVVTCRYGMWNGSGLETQGSTITCRSDDDNRLNNVAFENNSSRAVWVYAISESCATGNSIAWRTWTSGGGFTSSTTESDNLTGNIESVQLNTDLLTTSMIALTSDSAGDLNYHAWDGTDWVTNTTDLHSNIQNSEENAEAYGFGFDRNLETLAAYRWFANNNGTDVGSALTNQDANYTLTTANQQFRLRIILYYPDSLAISGRQYKLQYVDPGTGTCASPTGGTPSTWTDVPTSGGQINFNNNASPADGDNLTDNASDPSYGSYTERNQDYEEENNFTNSVAAMSGDEVAKWDFSLIDSTTFDRIPQTFCFRVARSNDLVLQILKYPQITTFAISDVEIRGGSTIQGGTELR